MDLETRLANELIRRHPERAAAVLEAAGEAEAARVVARGAAPEAAAVLRRLSQFHGAALLEALEPERAAELLAQLGTDDAACLVRRIDEERRELLLARLPARRARDLRAVLRFAEGTAGALMDPEVLALPEDLAAGEALARVRASPERARYNLYVVDREQRLVGVLNLRELLLAPPRTALAAVMQRDPQRLAADAERSRVLAHPGWREVHALPVVDGDGRYLGAVRYRTLRALEAELLSARRTEPRAAAALGELFAAGAAGLLEALGRAEPAAGGRRGGAE